MERWLHVSPHTLCFHEVTVYPEPFSSFLKTTRAPSSTSQSLQTMYLTRSDLTRSKHLVDRHQEAIALDVSYSTVQNTEMISAAACTTKHVQSQLLSRTSLDTPAYLREDREKTGKEREMSFRLYYLFLTTWRRLTLQWPQHYSLRMRQPDV